MTLFEKKIVLELAHQKASAELIAAESVLEVCKVVKPIPGYKQEEIVRLAKEELEAIETSLDVVDEAILRLYYKGKGQWNE